MTSLIRYGRPARVSPPIIGVGTHARVVVVAAVYMAQPMPLAFQHPPPGL